MASRSRTSISDDGAQRDAPDPRAPIGHERLYAVRTRDELAREPSCPRENAPHVRRKRSPVRTATRDRKRLLRGTDEEVAVRHRGRLGGARQALPAPALVVAVDVVLAVDGECARLLDRRLVDA